MQLSPFLSSLAAKSLYVKRKFYAQESAESFSLFYYKTKNFSILEGERLSLNFFKILVKFIKCEWGDLPFGPKKIWRSKKVRHLTNLS